MNIKEIFCPNHYMKIEFLNIQKGVEKELRALCERCYFIDDAMKLEDVLPIWENHKKTLINELMKQRKQILELPSKLEEQYQILKKNLQEGFEETQQIFLKFQKQIYGEINWQINFIASLNEIQYLSDFQDMAEIIADEYDIKNLYLKKLNQIEIYYEHYDFMQHRFNLIVSDLKKCTQSLNNLQNIISLKVELQQRQIFEYMSGKWLFDLEKYEQAIEYYDKVLQIYQNHDEAHRFKGIALQTMGKFQEAIKCYDEAIFLNPLNSNAFSNKGNTLQLLKLYEEAIICYNEAIRLSSLNSKAINNKGVALHNLNRDTEAVECYDLALKIKPNYRVYMENKCMEFFYQDVSLKKMNKNDEALRQIEDQIFHVNSSEERELAGCMIEMT